MEKVNEKRVEVDLAIEYLWLDDPKCQAGSYPVEMEEEA